LIAAGGRVVAAGALAFLLPLTTACLGPGDFHCTQHAQCTIGNVAGICEANGHCSVFEMNECAPSHRRYAHHAGGDADACVPASCADNTIKMVSAGGGHACLIRTDGSVWCWGRNDRGQLGDGTRTPRPLPVRVGGVSNIIAVAAGDTHTCAAEKDGPVWCWGADDSGQLGDSGSGGDRGLPQKVLGVMAALAVVSGKDF
jgi:hypothetical protein